MWAVLTRLEEPKKADLTLLQKLKLYNGKTLPGFTEDNIKELRKEADARGHGRASARATSRTRSPTPWSPTTPSGVHQPVHGAERAGERAQAPLADHQRGAAEAATASCSRVVKEEYEDIVKNEVQRAIAADEDAHRAGSAATTSTTSRPTRRRRRSGTSTPARTRSRTSG